MNTTITVPKTIGKAKQRLAAITADRRVSGWERAAIVWAHTRGAQQGAHTPDGGRGVPAMAEALGLSTRTIDRARKAWKTAMEQYGAPDIQPGEAVPQSILALDYPPTEETDETGVTRDERGAKAYIAKHPEVVVEAVKALPQVADAVVAAVVDDLDLANKHARVAFHKQMTGKTLTKDPGPATPTIIPDYAYDKAVVKAIGVIDQALNDEESGDWTPEPGSKALLSVLFLRLRSRAERIEAEQPEVHADIADFLASARNGGDE